MQQLIFGVIWYAVNGCQTRPNYVSQTTTTIVEMFMNNTSPLSRSMHWHRLLWELQFLQNPYTYLFCSQQSHSLCQLTSGQLVSEVVTCRRQVYRGLPGQLLISVTAGAANYSVTIDHGTMATSTCPS